jgi:hypothetical protein
MSWKAVFENPMVPSLPVLFRAEKSGQFKGDVTAVFPTLPGTNAYDFTVYAHVGQHGTGTMGWYYTTRPAKPEEYASLLRELRGIYESEQLSEPPVKLRVVQRITQDMERERKKNLTGFR